MACNESLDCSTAIDLLNFVRPIIAVSKLSTLRLHFAHLRFAEPSSSFNVISNRTLIVDRLVFPGCFYRTILYYGSYKPEDPQRRHTDAIFTNWAA